ncbi:MAG: leucine-rich repeat domain-containing protein, partial [Cyanobacteria bacterium MAG CAR3_bin_5]|nr:leucine-rich repeat domain-containing protein [Cyanobacteria bacterium MAG CAR3_bin_5]
MALPDRVREAIPGFAVAGAALLLFGLTTAAQANSQNELPWGDDTGVATFSLSGNPWVGETLTITKTSDDPDGNPAPRPGVLLEEELPSDREFRYAWQFRIPGKSSYNLRNWNMVLGPNICNPGDNGANTSNTCTVLYKPIRWNEPITSLGGEIRGYVEYRDGNGNWAGVYTNAVGPIMSAGISFSQESDSVEEDVGTHNVGVTLNPAPAANTTFTYTVNGTATAGSDFTIANSGVVTVPAGATTATIPVTIIDDSIEDSGETVVLTLSPNGDYVVGVIGTYTLTIHNQESTEQQKNICERHDAFESLPVVIRKLVLSNHKNRDRYPKYSWGNTGSFGYKVCNLSNKGITSLVASDFNGLSDLGVLLLDSNALTSLSQGVFNKLPNLFYLDLRDTSLNSLPSDMFNRLHKLQSLDLSENNLTTLPEDMFNGLYKLQRLNLSYNSLTTLPEGILGRGRSGSLFYLHLQNNQLTSLPENMFKSRINGNRHVPLFDLELQNNQLTSLPENIFDSLWLMIKPSAVQRGGINFSNNPLQCLPKKIITNYKHVLKATVPIIACNTVNLAGGSAVTEGGD